MKDNQIVKPKTKYQRFLQILNDNQARYISESRRSKKIEIHEYELGEEVSDELVKVADQWLRPKTYLDLVMQPKRVLKDPDFDWSDDERDCDE